MHEGRLPAQVAVFSVKDVDVHDPCCVEAHLAVAAFCLCKALRRSGLELHDAPEEPQGLCLTFELRPWQVGHAQMLKGGVIMDVMNPEQARIAQAAGACAGA